MISAVYISKAVILLMAFGNVSSSDEIKATIPSLEVFATSDLVRVFEDGYGYSNKEQKEINVFGIRNEIISAQCAIKAHEAVENITVSIEPLKHSGGLWVIPEENISWNFVGNIYIQENTPKLRKSDLTRPAPAWFPDYLSQEATCSLKKDSLKGIYFTIHIPKDTEAGEYRSLITVNYGDNSISLPLILTVYPITLPDTRHVMVTEWFSTSQFRKHHALDPGDSEGFFRLLKIYAENMVAHRQNVFRVSIDLIESIQTANGKLTFDFSRFDQWAQIFWDTGHMDLLETGFIAHFGEGNWSSTDILLRDFRVKDEVSGDFKTISGKEFLPQFLPAFVGHLRTKGWLEKTVFHICDEPSNHNIMAWREASDFVHLYAPELRRIDAIETTHCFERLEIWVPKLDHLATWQNVYEEAQRQGYEMWFYTVGIFQGGSFPNKTADVDLIESRLMHWLNYRYDLKGYLHWGFNFWTDDPFNAPGQHRGDGWHVYPSKDGLLNSLRWEQMRNGLQDYEYLWLLQDKIARIKTTFSKRISELIDPSKRGKEIASQVTETYSRYTKDPAVLYAAKRQIIEEILDLDKSPLVILQTNPLEHSEVFKNVSIDIYGWAEPGTKIKVNGRELPVASDGLFMEQLSPSSEGKIILEAEGKDGKKTIVRNFRVNS